MFKTHLSMELGLWNDAVAGRYSFIMGLQAAQCLQLHIHISRNACCMAF